MWLTVLWVGKILSYTSLSSFLKGVFSDEGTPLNSTGTVPTTGISEDRISHIGSVFSSVPDDFDEHRGTHTYIVYHKTITVGVPLSDIEL